MKELEWEQVRNLVSKYIGSPLGAAELAKVEPSSDRTRVERDLAEAGEAILYVRSAASTIRINLNGLPDITVAIQKLHIEGAALEPREIFDLIAFLDRAADAASSLNAAAERFPLLGQRARGIGDFRPLLKEIEGKIQADGTVLVAATDMHMGVLLGHSWANERAAQFESLRPDLLLLVGDIFEGDEASYTSWLPVLRQFRASHGVYVVTGNHEFHAGGTKIIDLFRRAGFQALRDESVEPIPGLVLTGVDDVAFRGRAAHAAILEKVLRQRPDGASILLSHTPLETQRAASARVELMLSGHTHAGQIWPFTYLVKLAFPNMSGRYGVQDMTAIVCRGTGTWGPRMRLFKRSELLRITVRAKS